MERLLRTTFTKTQETVHNIPEKLRSHVASTGVVIDVIQLEKDPSKTLIIYFNGAHLLKDGQRNPIYPWLVVDTQQVEQEHVEVGHIIRRDRFNGKITNFGAPNDIVGQWPGNKLESSPSFDKDKQDS